MNYSEWLHKEAGLWREEELITPEQHAALLLRYPVAKAANPLLLFFAVVGSLLIGAGVILIFATNWWRISVPIKLVIAFLPLLLAQGLGFFVALRKYSSPSWREGGAILISLAFFAAVALIGQVFHTPSDLERYLLVCGAFTLPVCYLLRSKAALLIFVGSALFGMQSETAALALFAAVLPLFYLELKEGKTVQLQSYLLTLLSAMTARVFFVLLQNIYRWYDAWLPFWLCLGLLLLVLDVLYRWQFSPYFFTPAKFFGTGIICVVLFISSFEFLEAASFEIGKLLLVLLPAIGYAVLRKLRWHGFMATDAFAAAAVLLAGFAVRQGIAASILMFLLGVGFLMWGSKTLRIAYLNIGMLWLMLLIGVRFFDSSLSLLLRGIVFILLGIAFLSVNIVVARKRRGQSI